MSSGGASCMALSTLIRFVSLQHLVVASNDDSDHVDKVAVDDIITSLEDYMRDTPDDGNILLVGVF